MRVALFVTCFDDTAFPRTGTATARLLQRLGQQCEFPSERTCCGRLHFTTGHAGQAGPLARRFCEVFRGYDAVVASSGSCVGMVRESYPVLAERDPSLAGPVAEVAPRVYELSEFLVDVLGVQDVGASFPHEVTYHPTCHSQRLLRVGDKPLRLLRAVRDIQLVELPDAEECCGFDGTFAVENAETSTAMLAAKMRAVLGTGARFCAAGDGSCLAHIGGGLSRLETGTGTVHLAEILAATPADPYRRGAR
jgi:L-lactate dehydrogenase complex protein LldE